MQKIEVEQVTRLAPGLFMYGASKVLNIRMYVCMVTGDSYMEESKDYLKNVSRDATVVATNTIFTVY